MKKTADKNWKKTFLAGAKVFFYLALVSFLLLWPSIWNGYPLVFSDTGTYLLSAFNLKVPFDRPIGYGYFIRLFSGGVNLWFVVYAQAFLTAYVFWKVVGVLVEKHRYFIHFCVLFCLSFLSSVPWMVSEIMPDIFPALILLIIFVFVASKDLKIFERCFLGLLLVFFLITHTANFLLALGFLFLASICVFFIKSFSHDKKIYLRRMAVLAGVTLFAPLFFITSNYHQGYGFVMSPASHVFMMSRVNEAGILDDYLLGHCANYNYFLCHYEGHFPQSDQFIWSKISPPNLEGWVESKPEYDRILHEVFTNPKYIFTFAGDSLYRSLKLFFMFGMDNYYPYTELDPVYPQISKFLPGDLTSFTRAHQYQGALMDVDGLALLFILGAWLHFLGLLWVFFGKSFTILEKFFVAHIFIFLVVNACIMGTLSGVYGRYQERVVWLVVFGGFLFIFKRLWQKAATKK